MSAPQTTTRLAEFIEKRTEQLRYKKSQKDIADSIGFENPNIISQMKRGKLKLALDRVPAMAKALECDPGMLFRLAWEQYHSRSLLNFIIKMVNPSLSEHEVEIIEFLREISDDGDPRLTPKLRSAITSAIK